MSGVLALFMLVSLGDVVFYFLGFIFLVSHSRRDASVRQLVYMDDYGLGQALYGFVSFIPSAVNRSTHSAPPLAQRALPRAQRLPALGAAGRLH